MPRAIALYKKWSAPDNKVAAIMGWGTADTEALTGFLAQDKIPDVSGSYAAALTDPEGTSGKAKPAPYNFFYGPSYSDALRAELTWAAEDWKAKGKSGKPKFVHMGANHPYPNAPKAAGEAIATELGFEVLPPLVFALAPGDYSAQCLSLKSAGANYAYLGNTAASNISVMKACKTAGVDVQFLCNVWGMDENAAKTAGDAADGVIFPLRTAVGWGGNAPGMKTVMEISKMSDPSGKVYRPVHYIAAICSSLYMKEALDWAAKNGGATGENVAKGFYQKKDWVPAGMEGVCNPSTWTEKDHRPTTKVDLYRSKVTGRDRRRSQRPDGQGHHQAREGQDGGAAAQAGMVRVVSARLPQQPRTRSSSPRRRGIQYAAASRLNSERLWNTGSPAFAGDDSGR